ncbi:MAG TPA: hypothetical protein VK789_26230 [Bryobacteraceae bacterium]|nr:hypothetical protein [Bryobacteraceae bacterium]
MRVLRIFIFVLCFSEISLHAQPRTPPVGENRIVSDLTIGIPILVGLLALAGAVWNTRKTAQAQAMTKAAELALQGEGPSEVLNRARLLGQFYGDLLPRNFVKRVDAIHAENVGRIVTEAPFVSVFQKEVITLLAQYPNQREQILADYKSVYPYSFFDNLEAATSSKPSVTKTDQQ